MSTSFRFKIIAIFGLFASINLAGCAKELETFRSTISAAQNFEVTQGQLDTARSLYDGSVLATMRKYAQLPRCKTGQTITLQNPCHDRKLLKQIRNVDIQVAQAFVTTQNSITSGDSKGAVAAYTTLKGLIDIAKALIAQTGMSVFGGG